MFSEKPNVTIIGFGAFGSLCARALAPHMRVSVLDPDPCRAAAALKAGHAVMRRPADLGDEIILLAVPVSAMEGVLTGLAPHLRPGQLVVDVCSVKERPARLMRDLLPCDVEILASHPMFGPQSARLGLAGSQIVLCPIRGGRWRRHAAFLRRVLGLKVLISTPEDHDRQAALTQGLTHILAHAYATFGPPPRIRTRSFELLHQALGLVAHDAPEVFSAITQDNRHLAELRDRLIHALASVPSGCRCCPPPSAYAARPVGSPSLDRPAASPLGG
ncbi:prephenate dehydrogenase/arogenate dehydrogenase family protein [Paracoccus sp. NSM]|uniref:prephenate dehydrogenase/arogenate dehydrogenase family protein n=1 Tax=Paracoccus sp. NSM TaxID=3457784 RepID=UPI0040374C73